MVSTMMRERRSFLLACAVIGASSLLLLDARAAQAPTPGRQTADAGPFTAAQADAGRVVYDANCGTCHGADLAGAAAPALAGPAFAGGWRTRTTGDLLSVVQTMPPSTDPIAIH